MSRSLEVFQQPCSDQHSSLSLCFLLFLYGLFVDFLYFIFKVSTQQGIVKTGRLVASMTLGTGFTGFLSYHISVLFELLPRNFALEVSILATGNLSGSIAGYIVAIIWNKHLKNTRFRQFVQHSKYSINRE